MNNDAEGRTVFGGWARVELFGHVTEMGYVTTHYFGNAAMFQIDQPALPEREVIICERTWHEGRYIDAGSKVRKPALVATHRLVGPGSIYSMQSVSEEDCLAYRGGLQPFTEVIEAKEVPETDIPF